MTINKHIYILLETFFLSQAGIVTDENGDNLVLALESEAALSYCMKLPAAGFINETREGLQDLRSTGNQHIAVVAEGSLFSDLFFTHKIF